MLKFQIHFHLMYIKLLAAAWWQGGGIIFIKISQISSEDGLLLGRLLLIANPVDDIDFLLSFNY